MGLVIDAAAYSYIGGRKNNEDNFYMNGVYLEREQMDPGGQCNTDFSGQTQIYAVCDGMGGAMFGEESSLLAVRELKKYQGECDQPDSYVNIEQMLRQISDGINNISYSRNMPAGSSGSTIAMLIMRDWYFRCVHVGDSRIYRLRGRRFERLTKDHSQVQQLVDMGRIRPEDAFRHPLKNIITQHLGMPNDRVDMVPSVSPQLELRRGDKYLICSDGLSDVVHDEIIAQLLNEDETAIESAAALVRRALKEANDIGVAADNITVVRLDVRETGEKGREEKPQRWRKMMNKLRGTAT